MRRICSLLTVIMMICTLGMTAFASDGASLLKQKMKAKGRGNEEAKIISQYNQKFSNLLSGIEDQYNSLYDEVDQNDNLLDEDRSALLDILQNDEDYSFSAVQNDYRKMMSNLPKNDTKALLSLFETKFEKYSTVLENLNEFENDLPQYYIDNSSGDNNYENSDDGNNSDED